MEDHQNPSVINSYLKISVVVTRHNAFCASSRDTIVFKSIQLHRSIDKSNILEKMNKAISLPFHPNVLPVCRSIHEELQLVIPIGDAVSLQSVISTSYPNGLHERSLAIVLRPTLEGLCHIHRQEQIHGDVKPAYIFIDSEGSVKLANFGLFANDSIEQSLIDLCTSIPYDRSLLELRTRLPYWIPPELSNINSRYNSQTDIWFFGLTALQLAHGGTPSYEKKIKISEDFKKLVASCLQQNPSDRPTASALMNHPFFRQLDVLKDFMVKNLCQALNFMTVRDSSKKSRADSEASESTPDTSTVNLNYHQRISRWKFNEDDLEFSPFWEEEGLIKSQREESAYLEGFISSEGNTGPGV